MLKRAILLTTVFLATLGLVGQASKSEVVADSNVVRHVSDGD